MSNLFETPERLEAMDFSEPYLIVETVMVVKNTGYANEAGLLEELAESFEKTFIREDRWKMILRGLGVTLEISALSGVFGTALGFGLCLVLRSRKRAFSALAGVICKLMDGIPSMVVLLIVNFIIFASSDVPPIAVAVITFSVMFSVAVAGTLNAGINAVNRGQSEAASALGFTKSAGFLRVVLPQAVSTSAHLQERARLHDKDDLHRGLYLHRGPHPRGDLIRSRTFEAFFPLIATAVIYFIISVSIASAIGRIELRIDPHKRPRRLPRGVVPTEAAAAQERRLDLAPGELIRIEHLRRPTLPRRRCATSTPS